MLSIRILWPHVDGVPGFEPPEMFRQAGALLLRARWPGATGPIATPGNWEGVGDLHDAFELRDLPEGDLPALRVLAVLVKCLSGQNSIALQPLSGEPTTYIDDVDCAKLSDSWRSKFANAAWPQSRDYLTCCPLVVDDVAVFGMRISPPLARGPHSHDEPHDASHCPIQADETSLRDFRLQLNALPPRPRSLPTTVTQYVLERQHKRINDIAYATNGDVVFGPAFEKIIDHQRGLDQPHWGIWPPGELKSMSEDQNWWDKLRFFPTMYRYNAALEHLAHSAPSGAASLDEIYSHRATLEYLGGNRYSLIRPNQKGVSLSFTADWINRAVSQVTLVTSDEKVVIAKRGQQLDYYPGCWDATLGEGLQPVVGHFDEAATGDSRWPVADRCLIDGVMRCLREEVRIGRQTNVSRIWTTAIGREWSNGNVAVFSTVWLPMTFEQFAQEYKRRFTEATALAPLPMNKVLDACTTPDFEPTEFESSGEVQILPTPKESSRAMWTGHSRAKLLLTALAHYTRGLTMR